MQLLLLSLMSPLGTACTWGANALKRLDSLLLLVEVDSHFFGFEKVNHAHDNHDTVGGAHLPLSGLEHVSGEPLMSVTRGQCDARPTVTFRAARHHRPLAGTKLYRMVIEAQVC